MHRRDPDGNETRAIASLVELDGKRVLDVGCGDGRLTAFAAGQASYVYAFDPNQERIAEARDGKYDGRVRLAAHDITALDVARERFDLALCGWSLWCLPVEDVVDALRTIHSAVQPGGIVVDTQPVAPRAPVYSGRRRLGSVDTREFAATVRAIDAEFGRVLALGLFALKQEERVEVAESFDDGPECADDILEWNGARLSRTLEAAIRRAPAPLAVMLDIRLRILVAR